ncbi:isoprenylcysteine carboxyl methyltransferase [Brevundimonas sp. Root1279]|nr:isoprenylcysteine carboxyl methyltransferase [Brevundimonas sp. Root1279]
MPPPLIFAVGLAVGWGLTRVVVDPGLSVGWDVRRYVAFALIAGGLLIDGAAAGHFRRLGTHPAPWKETTALATDGLYRFSRNPIYIGFAMMYLGIAVAMNSLITVGLLAPCLIAIDRLAIVREEAYLAAKFGPAYEAYRKKVRRWL